MLFEIILCAIAASGIAFVIANWKRDGNPLKDDVKREEKWAKYDRLNR